ncbi:6-phosphofructo-2-kinase-domain-containing protein [Halteromyces radiatus]|uniref:6-phosphofructo-2-kinase-domain-containing protein n=1 Tax=Halteromyces radiatus TaxID=101107 RepID=UPI00221FB5F7|nr:6-phosphofructo-2-kinase-domain-containing protein [Halteromyces radiatus]KAI8097064.1 6-phosphofructo-2-kinase-domain-containing protein [Halteromyces radiatus]
MAAQLYKTETGRLFHAGAICVVTVGLPACGKTHCSRILSRYMRWLGVATKVFSVGDYRRKKLGSLPADWFDQGNQVNAKIRADLAEQCLDDAIHWLLDENGQLAILDSNNVTAARRKAINDKLLANHIQPLFIEFICTDTDLVLSNIISVKLSSPDYIGWDVEKAVQDYKQRIERNKAKYETICDMKTSFIKMIDAGRTFNINKVEGYLQSKIVYFLLNIHIQERTIYLARAGNSKADHSYKIDAPLSNEGHIYAQQLAHFIAKYRSTKLTTNGIPESEARPLSVWTSTRRKGVQTALPFSNYGARIHTLVALTQLNPGEVDDLTEQEIEAKFPDELVRAKQDPYHHRYPRG